MAPGPWLFEFRAGLRSLPYLADHGFHDLVVMPGVFFIELARRIHSDLFETAALTLHRIEFDRPVILTQDAASFIVRVDRRENGRIGYQLLEGPAADLLDGASQKPCAQLEIATDWESSFSSPDLPQFDGNEIVETAMQFYGSLRRNGNQYGPAFQTVSSVSRNGSHALGQLSDVLAGRGAMCSLPVLDAAPQLLASLALDRGRTFILKSIERIVMAGGAGQPSRCAIAYVSSPDEVRGAGLDGSVSFLDADGNSVCVFDGIALAFIDPPEAGESSASVETHLCIASTFTAEPLEESLTFWSHLFHRKAHIEFAPYNQVFQQLLDPASLFARNRDGVNVIILSLDDCMNAGSRGLRDADPTRVEASLGAHSRTVLPNGIEVASLNPYETDYVYREIFEDQTYFRNGIELPDGATVIDVGANIGLFSLFVLSQCRDASIYSYEPSPRVFDLLKANCAAYGNPGRVHAFSCGVASGKGRARLAFYANSSVFSSFHPDIEQDRAAIDAIVRNVLQNELSSKEVPEADVQHLTADRLASETIDCPLTSISEIIRENGIERIDLLKIDAERSEIEILRGIEVEHWPLIEQIVMEVHDRSGSDLEFVTETLTRRGFHCAVVEETLLKDSGLFNIYARRESTGERSSAARQERWIGEFCNTLDTFVNSSSTSLILAIAPRRLSPVGSCLDEAEKTILARTARHPQIRVLGSAEIASHYPVREFHDPHSNQIGHMPFTPEGYIAVGTALYRVIFRVGAPLVKVIALDCDNTLWQGQCGEDGPEGVQITMPFRRLQEFMVAQRDSGVLIALCSKNVEADALAVFELRSEMVLRKQHLAAWQISWKSKPEALRALAAQLNLGLDSFVFIDDNPLECAAVASECPDVVVLQLPPDCEQIPEFLERAWILDHAPATREDGARNEWYLANSEREQFLAAAPTLREFLDALELRIDVAEATDEQLGRVAQLTARTNQFNFTSIRRSEEQVREFLRLGGACLVASVRDRFGDYGLVGAILYTSGNGRFIIDTFLLSCRALGKGVEHRMLADLAARALKDGNAIVEMRYNRTDRNEPARLFFEQFGSHVGGDFETVELPAQSLAELRFAPAGATQERAPDPKRDGSKGVRFDRSNLSRAMQRLGGDLASVDGIAQAMHSARFQTACGRPEEPIAPGGRSPLVQSLLAIWKNALHRTDIGVHDNFFDVGGTSLKAVVVVAMIRRELKRGVSLVTLFECPTIELLAARLDDSSTASVRAASAAETVKSRGQRRRENLGSRRVRTT